MKKAGLVFLILMILFNCNKKKNNTNSSNNNPAYPVPNVPVNVTIYPNDPQYAIYLQNTGGWVYLNGAGVQGLVIYRKTPQDFVALDRASPNNPYSSASKVKVQSDNFTLKDTVSGARWQIVDGAPVQGSSPWYLKQYATSYDGNALHIFN